MPKAAKGALFDQPSLAWVAERGPEIVAPVGQVLAMPKSVSVVPATSDAGAGAGGANVNLTATFNINAVDGSSVRDVVRNKIGPEFVSWLRTNFGKDQLRAALGVA